MSTKDLDDCETKLKADPQYLMQLLVKDRDKAEALIRAGQKQRPAARLWSMDVKMLFAVDLRRGKSLQGKERVAHFKYSLEYLQESYDVAVEALKKAPDERLLEGLPGLQIDLALVSRYVGGTIYRSIAPSIRTIYRSIGHLKRLHRSHESARRSRSSKLSSSGVLFRNNMIDMKVNERGCVLRKLTL